MGSFQKYWERYIKKQEETPRDKNAWKKEVAKAVVGYGKTPHTKESLEAYKKKLES